MSSGYPSPHPPNKKKERRRKQNIKQCLLRLKTDKTEVKACQCRQ